MNKISSNVTLSSSISNLIPSCSYSWWTILLESEHPAILYNFLMSCSAYEAMITSGSSLIKRSSILVWYSNCYFEPYLILFREAFALQFCLLFATDRWFYYMTKKMLSIIKKGTSTKYSFIKAYFTSINLKILLKLYTFYFTLILLSF